MNVHRRALLTSTGASLAAWLLACIPAQTQPTSAPPPAASPATQLAPAPLSPIPEALSSPSPRPAPAAASPSPAAVRGLFGYAFNSATQDVTVFDVGSRQALETRPLGATVRWLSNEQRFWDGRFIWTYDYPNNRPQAIAVDPQTVTLARTISIDGSGPAHSLMLTPDRKTAWLNAAGDDFLGVIDLASGQVAAQVKTGKFP